MACVMGAPVTPDDFKALIPDATASKCSAFTMALLRLPVTIYKLVAYMFDSNGNLNTAFIRLAKPTGSYEFAAIALTLDGSRLPCNGSAVSRTTYATLFGVIGTAFGVGDGSTTFNVPDFRDRFPIGQSGTRTGGSTGGAATVELTTGNMPEDLSSNSNLKGVFDETVTVGAAVTSGASIQRLTSHDLIGNVDPTPGTDPVDIMPPWLACFVYIAT